MLYYILIACFLVTFLCHILCVTLLRRILVCYILVHNALAMQACICRVSYSTPHMIVSCLTLIGMTCYADNLCICSYQTVASCPLAQCPACNDCGTQPKITFRGLSSITMYILSASGTNTGQPSTLKKKVSHRTSCS